MLNNSLDKIFDNLHITPTLEESLLTRFSTRLLHVKLFLIYTPNNLMDELVPTATIEYSCPSVCLCFSVCVCVCVCVCVYTITQKIMVQST